MVKEKLEIYRCGICGNIVETLFVGGGTLVCCGKEMILQVPNTVDASKEKHVPVVDKTSEGIKVKVGNVPHPMEEKHYIQWIELTADGKVYRCFLTPGNVPDAVFSITAQKFNVRAYCNLHGLWKS